MSRIVYMIGAGASRGKRGDKPIAFDTHKFVPTEGNYEGREECANILSGIPIVNEIPGRLQWLLQQLRNKNNPILKAGGSNSILSSLIADLEWLAVNASKHASIDTFAKKLYLTNKQDDYFRLKRALIVFLNYEQMVNQPEPRYDSFLASILQTNKDSFPEDVSIVSWNYDVQFEIAYREYYPNEGLGHLSYFLNVYDKTLEGKGGEPYKLAQGFQILKLNGSACINSEEYFFSASKDNVVDTLTSLYQTVSEKNCLLSFAWEKPKQQYIQRISDCVKDAQVLVIIGYSFPFFNREIDRIIFREMRSLGKIYIQDPYAENVKQSLRSALTAEQLSMAKMMNRIELIPINENQFFLPPEL